MPSTERDFSTGDTVTWSWLGDGLNIAVVTGQVTGVSVERQEIEVYWSDGSGPTWHRMEAMRKLDPLKLSIPLDVDI